MLKTKTLFLKNSLFLIVAVFVLLLASFSLFPRYGYGQSDSPTTNAGATLSIGAQERNQIPITVITSGADQVILSSYLGEGTGNRALLGQARKVSSTEWRYAWDITTVPPGTHRVFAVIVRGTARSETEAISVTVKSPTTNVSGSGSGGSITPPSTTLPGLPPLTPPTVTETDDQTISSNLDNLSTVVNDLGNTIAEQDAQAVEEVTQEINTITANISNTLQSEKESVTQDITDTLLQARQQIRESVFVDDTTRIEEIKKSFEVESENHIKRLEGILGEGKNTLDSTSLKDVLTNTLDEVVERAKETQEAFIRRGGLSLYLDSDRDTVSDYDEKNIYKTNPESTDSDSDGISDGDELLGGTNPLSSSSAPIPYADPNVSGATTTAFRVTGAKVIETLVRNGVLDVAKIRFEGKALPNSFVTLFIYSSPIVVTVKADIEGNWNYVLDKELADGNHTIFVAAVDTTGKILAKSAPSPFVKQADAVELSSLFTTDSPLSLFSTSTIFIVMGSVVVLGLLAILYINHQHKKRQEEIAKLGGTTF